MSTCLDHITVVAPSLEAGSHFVRGVLGIEPYPGRAHPSMGTHNRLLRLGDTVYLEVIAPDPDAPPISRPRWFGLDYVSSTTIPRLATWVASTDDIVGVAVPDLGFVETMRRATHTWQMTLTADGQLPLMSNVRFHGPPTWHIACGRSREVPSTGCTMPRSVCRSRKWRAHGERSSRGV